MHTERETAELDWTLAMSAAEAAIPLIGRLQRDSGVIANANGRSLIGRSAPHLLRALRSGLGDGDDIHIQDALVVLAAAEQAGLRGSRSIWPPSRAPPVTATAYGPTASWPS